MLHSNYRQWWMDGGLSRDEIYFISSAYLGLVTRMFSYISSISTAESVIPVIWSSWPPLEVIVFSWQLLKKHIPTNDNLLKTCVHLASRNTLCPFCSSLDEYVSHLFVTCEVSSSVWYCIFRWLQWWFYREIFYFSFRRFLPLFGDLGLERVWGWSDMMWFGLFGKLIMLLFLLVLRWHQKSWKIWASIWRDSNFLGDLWLALVPSRSGLRILFYAYSNIGVSGFDRICLCSCSVFGYGALSGILGLECLASSSVGGFSLRLFYFRVVSSLYRQGSQCLTIFYLLIGVFWSQIWYFFYFSWFFSYR